MINSKTPSEEFGRPVIGKIFCKLVGSLNGVDYESPVDEFEVIQILDNGDSKVYVCNQWNSPGVVQLVTDVFVIRFEEK